MEKFVRKDINKVTFPITAYCNHMKPEWETNILCKINSIVEFLQR